jgi:hypothetical protein
MLLHLLVTTNRSDGTISCFIFFDDHKCSIIDNKSLSLNQLFQGLKVFQRVTPGGKDVFFHIQPKGHYHINNYRRAHCKKRNINKPHSYAAGGNTKLFTQWLAYPENPPLY